MSDGDGRAAFDIQRIPRHPMWTFFPNISVSISRHIDIPQPLCVDPRPSVMLSEREKDCYEVMSICGETLKAAKLSTSFGLAILARLAR